MKLIYSGGWNNELKASIENCFLYSYRKTIFNAVKMYKKVAIVTLAKPDGYYDHLLKPLYNDLVEIIDHGSTNVAWQKFEGIFIPGGNATNLYNGLKKLNFDLNKLAPNVVVLGDSAGAYVLSSYFYQSPSGPLRGLEIEFKKGLNSDIKLITIAHKNNPKYCNNMLISKVNAFASKNQLQVLMLAENEQKLFERGKFIDVDKENLFE